MYIASYMAMVLCKLILSFKNHMSPPANDSYGSNDNYCRRSGDGFKYRPWMPFLIKLELRIHGVYGDIGRFEDD